ncbi:MAG: hypothetical protein HPY53_15290 [Brevinematales bacterium]|nr:hypothetical protein [Brevinematales bacterium]
MRKFLGVLAIAFISAGISYGAPTYTGAEGYITMPRVGVADAGRFGLTIKYTFNGLITPAINIVPFNGFEIGAGWDISGNNGVMNPLMGNVKIQFVKEAAIGFMMEIPTANYHAFHGTIYLAWEQLFSASGVSDDSATFAVGYTFDRGSDINVFIGIQKSLFIPQLYIVADFSNFPYRFGGWLPYQSDGRGVLNLGLRIVPLKWISFDIAGLDLFDGNRSWMIGANLYVSLWGGGSK